MRHIVTKHNERELPGRIKREPRTLSSCRDYPYADRNSNTCSFRWIDLRDGKTDTVSVG